MVENPQQNSSLSSNLLSGQLGQAFQRLSNNQRIRPANTNPQAQSKTPQTIQQNLRQIDSLRISSEALNALQQSRTSTSPASQTSTASTPSTVSQRLRLNATNTAGSANAEAISLRNNRANVTIPPPTDIVAPPNTAPIESNRLDLGRIRPNLADTRSRITDIDIAEETANLTRAQAMAQMGASILTQRPSAADVELGGVNIQNIQTSFTVSSSGGADTLEVGQADLSQMGLGTVAVTIERNEEGQVVQARSQNPVTQTTNGVTETVSVNLTSEGVSVETQSVSFGGFTVNNIQAGTAGGTEAITGSLDLQRFGLGTVDVALEQNDAGQFVGAALQQGSVSLDLGGGASLSFDALDGQTLLTVDQNGIDIAGNLTLDVGGQSFDLGSVSAGVDNQGGFSINSDLAIDLGGVFTQDLSNVDFEIGQDENGNQVVNVNGQLDNVGAGGTEFSVQFSSNGAIEATVSAGMIDSSIPGFSDTVDTITNALAAIGVEVDTSLDFGVTVNPDTQFVEIEGLGMSGSYDNQTGIFTLDGIGAGIGVVSVGLEDLSVNTQTGAFSGTITGGVGVGLGDMGVSIDLAGFSFGFDPTENVLTLTGTQGFEFANVQVTAELELNDNGVRLRDLRFAANIDNRLSDAAQQLSQDVAAGLNTAFEQGTAVGEQALTEIRNLQSQGEDAVRNFARGLAQAGANAQQFITQTVSLAGDQLNRFLDVAGSAGAQFDAFLTQANQLNGDNLTDFLSSAANAGNDLSALIAQTSELSGTNLQNFLSTAASAGGELGNLITQTSGLSGNNLSDFLSVATNAGSELGNLITQTSGLSGGNLSDFLSTATNAGDDLNALLSQTAELTGTNLQNFLSTASSLDDQLGSFLTEAGNVSGNDLTNFLTSSATAVANDTFESFLSNTSGLSGNDLSNFLTSTTNAGNELNVLLTVLNDVEDVSGFLRETASRNNLQQDLSQGVENFKNSLSGFFGGALNETVNFVTGLFGIRR